MSNPTAPWNSDGGASLYRRDTVSFVRAGAEANIMAHLLLPHLTCLIPTDHTGEAGCTTALVSPDGWVHFLVNFHEIIVAQTNLLPLQRLSTVPIE